MIVLAGLGGARPSCMVVKAILCAQPQDFQCPCGGETSMLENFGGAFVFGWNIFVGLHSGKELDKGWCWGVWVCMEWQVGAFGSCGRSLFV